MRAFFYKTFYYTANSAHNYIRNSFSTIQFTNHKELLQFLFPLEVLFKSSPGNKTVKNYYIMLTMMLTFQIIVFIFLIYALQFVKSYQDGNF